LIVRVGAVLDVVVAAVDGGAVLRRLGSTRPAQTIRRIEASPCPVRAGENTNTIVRAPRRPRHAIRATPLWTAWAAAPSKRSPDAASCSVRAASAPSLSGI